MEKVLSVPEVHCDHCISSIEGALGALEGVEEARVDLDEKNVTVRFDETHVAVDSIVGAIEDQGYDVGDSPKIHEIGKRPGAEH